MPFSILWSVVEQVPEALIKAMNALQPSRMYCDYGAPFREKPLLCQVNQPKEEFAGVDGVECNSVLLVKMIEKL